MYNIVIDSTKSEYADKNIYLHWTYETMEEARKERWKLLEYFYHFSLYREEIWEGKININIESFSS